MLLFLQASERCFARLGRGGKAGWVGGYHGVGWGSPRARLTEPMPPQCRKQAMQLASSLATASFLSRHKGWASCQDSQPLSLSLLGKNATSSPKCSSEHWEPRVCRTPGWEQPTAGCCCLCAAGTGPVPAHLPRPRQGPCCAYAGCRDTLVVTSGQGQAWQQSHPGVQRVSFAARLTGTCSRCRKAGPG